MTQEKINLFLLALGRALARLGRPLVYGGGTRGIMGIISGTVLNHGGSVTAVVPAAMLRGGGEGDQTLDRNTTGGHIVLAEEGKETVQLLRYTGVYPSELHDSTLNLGRVRKFFHSSIHSYHWCLKCWTGCRTFYA